jgi:putative endonuclease
MANKDGARDDARIAAPERVAAFRTGLSAESRAAAYLMAKGYRILARRFRTPQGEIDIVARQQQRIIGAAQAWLMTHPEHEAFELRFDAMLIAPRRLPRHLLGHLTPALSPKRSGAFD